MGRASNLIVDVEEYTSCAQNIGDICQGFDSLLGVLIQHLQQLNSSGLEAGSTADSLVSIASRIAEIKGKFTEYGVDIKTMISNYLIAIDDADGLLFQNAGYKPFTDDEFESCFFAVRNTPSDIMDQSIQSTFSNIVDRLSLFIRKLFDVKSTINADSSVLANNIDNLKVKTAKTLSTIKTNVRSVDYEYQQTFKRQFELLVEYEQVLRHVATILSPDVSRLEVFADEFSDNYGWKEVLSGAGYIGVVFNLINEFRHGITWRDFAKTGIDTFQFLSGAAKTYSNYKKIGNAVGTKTAMAWWAKSITGLKPLGRASVAKNPLTRFANNLTNKTSPFNAQLMNVVDNFKGANGVGKAVASWSAVAFNGVLNWFSNKDEQSASNGTMSDGRVVAETITETVVDTALTYGAGIVVGAAVTAVAGTVAAPGIVVVAASGAVVAGVNAGVKALTGKTTTEWLSDTILDTGEAIGNAVGSAAKSVSESIGRWFGKLSIT